MLVLTATMALTILLYMVIPKGFFPVQDTGVIQGVSEADQTISFKNMSIASAEAIDVILQGSGGREPVFIHRRGWLQHHPECRTRADQSEANWTERKSAPAMSSAACSRNCAKIDGITLYMQPVQDLSVEDIVSRTAVSIRSGRSRCD